MVAYEVAVTSTNEDGEINAEWCIIASFDRTEAERVYMALKPINESVELREWKCEDGFTTPVEAIEFSKEFELIEPSNEVDKESTGYQIYVKRPEEKSYTKWLEDKWNWYPDEESAVKRVSELIDSWKPWNYHYIVVACCKHTVL